jgi:aryl-alcohol dehydrogenase-like predicted oxidoreductase
MQKRKLGAFGPDVSIVGLGANNFGGRTDAAASARVIAKALDCGITLIDTSDNYGNRGGSEGILGKALGARRKDVVLATKFGLPMDNSGELRGASRRYAVQAIEASLRRLNTDWIDLYQVHFPDSKTPIEETLRALDDLVKAGKVRCIGCSNFSAAQLQKALGVSQQEQIAAFVTCQYQYNLLERGLEKDSLPVMREHGLGLLPYFPLASGLLTGKYKQDAAPAPGTRFAGSTPRGNDAFMNARNWRLVHALSDFAARRGHTLLELAFSWLVSRPYIPSVIAGATRPEQIEQNIAAAGWALTDADIAEIDRITL